MVVDAGELEWVRRVLAYRQHAKLGEWVTYATGEPLDRRHPVAALVKGWAKKGLVELREKAGPDGERWHQFQRLKADFPAWCHYEPEPLRQPPAKRDTEAVGIHWMAWWASRGDERPEWLHYAASHYRAKLLELSSAAGDGDLPSDAAELLANAGLVMMTIEQMLDPGSTTQRQLKVKRRPITEAEKAADIAAGRKPRRKRMTHDQALKEHAAAAQVERAVAAGDNRLSAIKEAAKDHHVGQGDVGARLANRAAWLRLPADRKLAEATEIASALQTGGLLQKDALAVAWELTGLSAADIRKAMKSR